MAFNLNSLKRNAVKPPRIIIHGEPGIGKTTFAVSAPKPVVIQTEDGLGNLDVTAFPVATSFNDVLEAITALYTEDHDFKTLVVDSLDWLEPLIWAHVCEFWKDNKGTSKRLSSIEDAGYGKGYIEAIGYWRQFFDGITALRNEKNMGIILIAHSQKIRVEDPTMPAYDSFDLKLHKRAAAVSEEFADVILFAAQHVALTTEKERVRAVSNGKRVIHAVGQPAFLAKNRYNLPASMPLDWASFEAELNKAGVNI